MNVVMKTDDHRTVTTAGTLPQSGAIRHGSWTGRHCCEARSLAPSVVVPLVKA
ncbi:hypothetical protein PHYBLDRAFT_141185 [Phycomyces blakesleeanus NRRL 1555(-)]|uniref:Uncharacterized protein n=1 Tax=Phycomyces blakesleeanus (strain ATCC 8743b / DSM 1359 / FGSC 10004 / NBRC 33097 / NRRL 1555) TaxID=763407 RepID=A0A167P5R6_PHYB8|nr:hypothetical protein PHYBLDRAFT_141185 [Phycomyces blakesleeanus NRRL 1555(-)]OAD77299.1 hypothetical protein PHYBLDRAFT_141185 [Phycomyces blakesleeanus NRRL 1555(-)]|eukprot:XP_018295339.1 hypothetical protein PHYBLDRAFT_141185 [Phycomyces blakesleeanus NRRL 1555(-)]